MSRSGYTDDGDFDTWSHVRWRGAVTAAFRGKRGQAFLREMLEALDALPENRLITGAVVDCRGCACALGAVALKRGLDVTEFDDVDEDDLEYFSNLGPMLGIAESMGREIMYYNDEVGPGHETPEQRFDRMRRWIERQIIEWETT